MPSQDCHVLLQCESLSRTFSANKGVHGISLTLREGDVLGLLGLNGAGKSTTLRMLCGVLAPDEGSIHIAGHNLEDEPMRARAAVGYLPDQPPLYSDMRVDSYLRFAAKLRRVKKSSLQARLDYVVEACDLQDVRRSRIAKLSKGYRQRVGVAQALIHNPKVLLLDEPSNGLDPQQLSAMRDLIKSSAINNSVIFSTHLLSEAQAVCNRIAVLHEGKLVADFSTTEQTNELDQLFSQLVNKQPAPMTAAV